MRPPFTTRDVIARWLPVALWAALISVLSSDSFSGEHTASLLRPVLEVLLPGAAPATIETAHAITRKLAHVTEYAVLAVLVFRALERPGRTATTLALATIAFCALYASFDELHQSLVPSRGPSPVDVALDTFGAALGVAVRLVTWTPPVSAGRRSPA